jgi:hypothetical protein
MYHIFAAQCHRQDSARLWEYHPSLVASTHSPCLVEAPAAVLARIGGMEEQVDLAGAGGGLDALGAVDQIARPRFHSEAVEGGLPERSFDPGAEVGGNRKGVGFERALQRRLQLVLGMSVVELDARDSDPRAAARGAGANVGCHGTVRPEREPDQLLFRGLAAGEDAGALRFGRF